MINNVNANVNAKTDGISVYKDCNRGTVAQIIGSVVDVYFEKDIPAISNALR